MTDIERFRTDAVVMGAMARQRKPDDLEKMAMLGAARKPTETEVLRSFARALDAEDCNGVGGHDAGYGIIGSVKSMDSMYSRVTSAKGVYARSESACATFKGTSGAAKDFKGALYSGTPLDDGAKSDRLLSTAEPLVLPKVPAWSYDVFGDQMFVVPVHERPNWLVRTVRRVLLGSTWTRSKDA